MPAIVLASTAGEPTLLHQVYLAFCSSISSFRKQHKDHPGNHFYKGKIGTNSKPSHHDVTSYKQAKIGCR